MVFTIYSSAYYFPTYVIRGSFASGQDYDLALEKSLLVADPTIVHLDLPSLSAFAYVLGDFERQLGVDL